MAYPDAFLFITPFIAGAIFGSAQVRATNSRTQKFLGSYFALAGTNAALNLLVILFLMTGGAGLRLLPVSILILCAISLFTAGLIGIPTMAAFRVIVGDNWKRKTADD